jgi:uncharacterized repeat protein (TIGR03803 family)
MVNLNPYKTACALLLFSLAATKRRISMLSFRSGKSLCAVVLLCAAVAISASAQTLNTPVSFDNYDGALPYAGVVQGLDGNYYGTTYAGGDTGYQGGDDCNSRCGVVYKITAAGTLTDVYKFCSEAGCADGYGPNGGLVLDSNDNFYGTTSYGGANQSGTVFQLSPTGTLKTIYSFSGGDDGQYPFSSLIQGPDGDLYGTTQAGGATKGGVIFKITTQGVPKTLYTFCNPDYCANPSLPVHLILGTDGNFYGTTGQSLFKITPAGVFTGLHTFSGSVLAVSLVQGPDGNFYGDTVGDGTNGNGTFFKFVPGGTPTVLYNFGSYGSGSLFSVGSDGNFYGLSEAVVQITPAGGFTYLGSIVGTMPLDALFQGTDGIFYGTTYYGGSYERCNGNACGTVFSLSMNLPPIVTAVPTAGPVGRNMYILGSDLTGATSVTFNGVSATFTVLSPTAIRTQVPVGATTGSIRVVTPSGTLTSGVVFGVL